MENRLSYPVEYAGFIWLLNRLVFATVTLEDHLRYPPLVLLSDSDKLFVLDGVLEGAIRTLDYFRGEACIRKM